MRRILLAAAATFGAGAASAAEEGILVAGQGEVRMKPDRLEFEFRNSGVAEIAGDASVKLRDAHRRTVAALEKLAVPNLKLEPAPLSAGYEAGPNQQIYYNNGMPQPAVAAKLELHRQTKVTIGGIDALTDEERLAVVAKLLDAARDAGAKFSDRRAGVQSAAGLPMRPGFLRYSVADPNAAKDAAAKKAFAHAEERGKKLAALAGGTLGAPLDIAEEPDPAPGAGDDGAEIAVRARLKVRFAFRAGK